MKKYWEKFFNLTVLESSIDAVNDVIQRFGDKIAKSEYHVYDVDGERIAHYSLIIADGGKKTFSALVKNLNSR